MPYKYTSRKISFLAECARHLKKTANLWNGKTYFRTVTWNMKLKCWFVGKMRVSRILSLKTKCLATRYPETKYNPGFKACMCVGMLFNYFECLGPNWSHRKTGRGNYPVVTPLYPWMQYFTRLDCDFWCGDTSVVKSWCVFFFKFLFG